MDSPEKEITSSGPFEVRCDESEAPVCAPPDSTALDLQPTLYSRTIEADITPRRRYDCGNYDTCLELAAALNWNSFTCQGCSGSINESLRWRAGQIARKDSVVQRLCGATSLIAFNAKRISSSPK